jgi:hypothetical protein
MFVRIDARLLRDPHRRIDPQIRRELYRGRNLTVTTSAADLDIVQSLPGVPSYAELEADSWEAELGGTAGRRAVPGVLPRSSDRDETSAWHGNRPS